MDFKRGWKKFWQIMSFAKPFWKLYALVTLLSIIAVNLGLASPWLLKVFLDDVLINRKFELFYWILGAIIGLAVFDRLFGFFQDMISTRLSQKMSLHIKKRVLDSMLNLHISFFHRKKVGDLMSRLQGTTEIQGFASLIINTIFVQGFRTISVLFISMTLSWKATLLTLAVFPFYLLSEKFFVKRMKSASKTMLEKGADLTSYIQETLNSVRLIKLFGREKDTSKKYEKQAKYLNWITIRYSILVHISSFITFFIQYMPSFAVLAFGGHQVMLGALTIGALVALRSYISQVFGSLESFFSLNRQIQLFMVPIDRILEIVNTEPKIKNVANPVQFQGVKSNIMFDNVNFSYGSEPVLKRVNFEIPKGSRVGIAGPSGEGKSTLANLMIRFYDPTKGNIKIDGVDLRKFELSSLRERIGMVSQEAIILNLSIRENIAFGKPEASKAEIEKAAKLAEIHDFIMSLPEGYNTIVGERGSMLSGGQKQRLSIARMLLLNPDIIILDEPTSALDPETEKKLQRSLDMVSRNRTSFVIAHRLSTLQNVDRVVFLEGHQIVEQGTFLELMAKKGRFFHFYNSQFRTYEEFLSRLISEIKRSRRYSRKINLATIELDVESLEQDQAKKLVEEAEFTLEQKLKDVYFFGVPPHFKHCLQVVLPELTKSEAEEYVNKLVRLLKYKLNFDAVNFSLISNIKEIEKITQ